MDDPRIRLHDLPLLQFVPPSVRTLVVDSFVPVTVEFGRPIVTEGEAADAFYVLVSGTARVLKTDEQGNETPLNVLRPGDSFGEIALLEETTQMATVRASSDVTALKLDKSVFFALVRQNPEVRALLELQVKHRHLHNFFRLYSPFVKLPVAAMRTLVTELEPVAVATGALVIREGEDAGPMYIVEEGRLRVFSQEDGQ